MKCPKYMLEGVPKRENNCGNQVAEIVGIRREKIWIVTTKLLKMGGEKKKKNCGNQVAENEGKKKCYVHNIFTSFSQQITGG